MFRAVGVRHKQRPFAVVAAPGAHRFAFFLPRRNASRRRLLQASLTRRFAQLRRVVTGAFSGVWAAGFAQSWAFGGLTEHLLNWQCAVHCDTTTGKVAFFARVMDAVRLFGDLCFVVCAVLAAL